MLARFLRSRSIPVTFALGLVVAACDVESTNMPASDMGTPIGEGGTPDTGRDLGRPTGCDDNGDCDDSVDCTTDLCEVGGVCRSIPDDGLCPTGQLCNPRGGCGSNACESATDCDDGQLCNGRERCVVGMCFPAELPETCDDGVECTIDRCDEATNRCIRELGPGCMPEAGPRDAGVPPFDPTRDYSGMFVLAPPQSAECVLCRFSISSVSMSVSGGTLTVNAGSSFTLTQTPAPTGADFDVSGSNACGTVRIVGSFLDSASFSGRWMGTYEAGCGNPDNPVFGSRL